MPSLDIDKQPEKASVYEEDGSEDLAAFGNDMADLDRNDIIMQRKMKLINDALDEIGFTWYHFKLFCLNGMGYATDSQITLLESLVRTMINHDFGKPFPVTNVLNYAGMLVGALFWGFLADLIGRKVAFNLSLLLSALFTIYGGTMGTLSSYGVMIFLMAWASGGNLVLDTTTFLEFLPSRHNWLVTFFAFFWGIGGTIAAATAYAFIPRYSCTATECPDPANNGWRYLFYTNGSIVLFFAIARVTIIRLKETPKFLVSNKRDDEAVANLQAIATKYGRPCSLTVEQLHACGEITSNEDYRNSSDFKGTVTLVGKHLAHLFSNARIARLTGLLWFSWLVLGIAYPLYTSFLPTYLALRGAELGSGSLKQTYRDNVISNAVSTAGPILLGLMLWLMPWMGSRGVMAFGGLTALAFLIGYAFIKTTAQNVAMSSMSYFAVFVYYLVLYAYSPSVMPSSLRATGNAMCIGCTRFASCFVALIGYYSDPNTNVPIFVCAALMGALGLLSLAYPFEPSKQRIV